MTWNVLMKTIKAQKIGMMNKRDTVVIFCSQDRITLPQCLLGRNVSTQCHGIYEEAHSVSSPLIFSIACFNAGRITARFSFALLGLPGRLIIRERPRIPTTAREIMA